MGMLVVPAGPATAIAWPAHQATAPGFAGSAAIWGTPSLTWPSGATAAYLGGAATVNAPRPKLTKCAPS